MGDNRLLGAAGEHRAMAELLLRGHNPAVVVLDNGADILLHDGTRIEVKASRLHRGYGNPRYAGQYGANFFHANAQRRTADALAERFDVAIIWCVDHDWFFIVPVDALAPLLGPSGHVTVSTTAANPGAPLQAFKDAWHLLGGEAYTPAGPQEPTSRSMGAMTRQRMNQPVWAKAWDACRRCGRTDRYHHGRGLCFACWSLARAQAAERHWLDLTS